MTNSSLGLRAIISAIVILATQNAYCQSAKEKSSDSDVEKIKTIEAMYLEYEKSFKDTPSIDPRETKFDEVLFVDVRELKEQEVSKITGAIPKIEFENNLEKYRSRKVVVYCTIGYRSGLYAQKLRAQSINAYNLKGGILLWAHAGKGIENKNSPTKKVHVYGKKWDLLPTGWVAIY